MRPVRALLGSAAGALVLAGAATSASADVEIAPVSRLPFPERGYVVGVSKAAHLDARSVVVRENGLRVTDVRVDPLAKSGIRYGVVLFGSGFRDGFVFCTRIGSPRISGARSLS